MRIVLLGNGKSIHIVRWANALCKNHEVYVICTRDNLPIQETFLEKVKVYSLPFSAPLGYYTNCIALKKLLKKINPDIVNAHYVTGYGTLARLAKVKFLIISAWGSDVYSFPYVSNYKFNLVKKNLEYAFKVLSTSNCMAEQIKRITNNVSDIAITPFGVDTKLFKPIQEKRNKRVFKFCTVKTLSKNYRIDLLISAYALFVEKLKEESIINNTIYEIYGEGEERKNLLNLIYDNNLSEFIFLKGYVENNELPSVLQKSDIFLLGSEKESFGVAAVEAMACGVPVITSNAEGFKEVVENDETGIIITDNSVEHFAEEMFKMYKDNERRTILSDKSRERVIRLYDWDQNVKTMERIYREVLNKKEGSL